VPRRGHRCQQGRSRRAPPPVHRAELRLTADAFARVAASLVLSCRAAGHRSGGSLVIAALINLASGIERLVFRRQEQRAELRRLASTATSQSATAARAAPPGHRGGGNGLPLLPRPSLPAAEIPALTSDVSATVCE